MPSDSKVQYSDHTNQPAPNLQPGRVRFRFSLNPSEYTQFHNNLKTYLICIQNYLEFVCATVLLVGEVTVVTVAGQVVRRPQCRPPEIAREESLHFC